MKHTHWRQTLFVAGAQHRLHDHAASDLKEIQHHNARQQKQGHTGAIGRRSANECEQDDQDRKLPCRFDKQPEKLCAFTPRTGQEFQPGENPDQI